MNQIRPWLYLGKYRETKDYDLLKTHSIGAMLQLAELVKHPGIISFYLAVEDGATISPQILKTGIEFVKSNKNAGRRTLVACGAGISRSATFAIASLKEIEQTSLLEAYHEVKQKHPETLPHPLLWRSLCGYYNVDIPFFKILSGISN